MYILWFQNQLNIEKTSHGAKVQKYHKTSPCSVFLFCSVYQSAYDNVHSKNHVLPIHWFMQHILGILGVEEQVCSPQLLPHPCSIMSRKQIMIASKLWKRYHRQAEVKSYLPTLSTSLHTSCSEVSTGVTNTLLVNVTNSSIWGC